MIAYKIQLQYVIRDKLSLRQNRSEKNSVQDKIQSEKKIFLNQQNKFLD